MNVDTRPTLPPSSHLLVSPPFAHDIRIHTYSHTHTNMRKAAQPHRTGAHTGIQTRARSHGQAMCKHVRTIHIHARICTHIHGRICTHAHPGKIKCTCIIAFVCRRRYKNLFSRPTIHFAISKLLLSDCPTNTLKTGCYPSSRVSPRQSL